MGQIEDEAGLDSTRSPTARSQVVPPRVREDAIERDRLTDRAMGSQGHIVVVSGPAGAGKSVLLAQCLGAVDHPAWLSLSSSANDAAVFWSSLIDAIGSQVDDFGHGYRHRLDVAGSTVVDEVVASMCDELTAAREPSQIFLDDVHLIDAENTLRSLARFMTELPATVRLFLGTRQPAALPLGRLRAEGRLTELSGSDLAMSVEEGTALLGDQVDRIGPASVATLVDRTEGWPAGLQLARLALNEVDDAEAFVSSFEGSDRFVADYLASQVLDGLSDEHRDFLLDTAFLPRLQAGLCDAVTGRTGSAAVLDALERRNAFVITLDHRRHWYRYHHLFAELLQDRARRRSGEEDLRLRRERAFVWFRDRGYPNDAVEVGLAAGRTRDVADLVAATWFDLLNSGRLQTAERWVAAFNSEEVEGHQPLAIAAALITGMSGHRLEAQRFLEMAQRSTYADPPPDGSASMASALALARGTLALYGVAAARHDGELVHELEPAAGRWRLLAALVVGLARVMQGDLEGAVPYLAEAGDSSDSALRSYAIAELALIRLRRGDPQSAARLADDARSLIREDGLDDLIMAAVAGGVAAQAWAAVGKVGRARRAMEDGTRAMEVAQHALPADAMHAHLVMAEAASDLGNLTAARQQIEDAREAAVGISDRGAMDSQLSMLESRLARAAATSPSRPPDHVALTDREREVLCLLPTQLTTREIGHELFLSMNTIKTYQRRIYRKLDASSREEAVDVARRLALLGEKDV